jgi:ATP-dependent DNA helicase RecQ
LFVSIDEKELARRANLSVTIIEQTLLQLSKRQVIIYQPQTENPQLTFVQGRVETRHLSFSQQVYNDRKKNAQTRLETVIHYAGTNTKCRNKLLLEYFNEKQSVRCGKCDVCLKRSEEELSQEEFETLQKNILSLLEKEDFDIDNLVKKLYYPEQKIIQVTRWLLDNEVIEKEMDRLKVRKKVEK